MGNKSSRIASRVALAIIGAVVVGGISAVLVVARPASHSSVALANTGRSQTTSSSSTPATAGATASHDQSATPGATPTTAAAPTATPRPRPLATPTATLLPSLQGTVVSKDPSANSFVLGLSNSSQKTVIVTSSTVFRGSASSLSTLGINWQANVTGTYQTDGTFLASRVYSCNGGCDT